MEAAEDEKEAEVVVIRDKNNLCRTEFVLVESVHYALVGNNPALAIFVQFSSSRKPPRSV